MKSQQPRPENSETVHPETFEPLTRVVHLAGTHHDHSTLRVQVPNNHILSKTVTYKTTIGSFGPLGLLLHLLLRLDRRRVYHRTSKPQA